MANKKEKPDALATTQPATPDIVTDPKVIEKRMQEIAAMRAVVQKSLQEGVDYGVIPGTQKPTLFKPGAEKMVKCLGLSDHVEIIERTENWEGNDPSIGQPFFYYMVKCVLKVMGTDVIVSEGIGSCNSKEDRYCWRNVFGNELPGRFLSEDGTPLPEIPTQRRYSKKKKTWYTVYKIPNENIFTQVNTIQKIAEKRAKVNAALSAGRLSDLFTQDLEDIYDKYQERLAEDLPDAEAAPRAEAKKEEPKKEPAKEAKPVKESKPAAAEKKQEPKSAPAPTEEAPESDDPLDNAAGPPGITEDQKVHIDGAIEKLVSDYGRSKAELVSSIQKRVGKKFGVIRKRVPEDLAMEEAYFIVDLLNKTLIKEKEKLQERMKNEDDEAPI